MTKFLACAAALLFTSSALAADAPPSAVQKIVEVGAGPFIAHEMPDGRLLLTSSNGRFVVAGPVRDMWTGANIRSLDELDKAINHVDLADLEYDSLGARMYGKEGAPRLTIFVDPACPWCHRQLKVFRDTPGLLDDYQIALIPVAVLSEQSDLMLRTIECEMSKEEADAWFWELGERPFPAMNPQTARCNQEQVERRRDLLQLLEVGGVPYSVTPDGRRIPGFRDQPRAWLTGEAE